MSSEDNSQRQSQRGNLKAQSTKYKDESTTDHEEKLSLLHDGFDTASD